jgi:hypothetical protein
MEGIATEAALPGSTSYCSLETLRRRGREEGCGKRWGKALGKYGIPMIYIGFIWEVLWDFYGISTEVLWDLYGYKDG